MKKSIFKALVCVSLIFNFQFLTLNSVQAQDNEVKIPSGYQGFLEQGPSYRFNDDGNISVGISTTHGFYFSDNAFIGIGIAFEGGNDCFAAPVFTALKYNFSYRNKVTPSIQLRLGSYLSDNVGAYADLAVGLRFGSKHDFAINVMVAGSFYSVMRGYRYNFYNDTSTDLDPSSVGIRIGIEW